MHICFKIIKFLLHYVFLHVSDTTVSIIRGLPPLLMQPLVTVWCCVGCVLQPCSVVTAVFALHAPDDGHISVRNM
jgi:ABC-type amino acid transport system permease subunit